MLNENLNGYKYYGLFPSPIIKRVQNSLQSGIIDWWQKYFKWVIKFKTQTEERKTMQGTSTHDILISSKNQNGAYVLCLLLCFGLLLATFGFIFYECFSNIFG